MADKKSGDLRRALLQDFSSPWFVTVRNLSFSAVVGRDAWGRENRPQPVVLSLRAAREDLDRAARADDVSRTLSYSAVCKDVLDMVRQEQQQQQQQQQPSGAVGAGFNSGGELAWRVSQVAKARGWGVSRLEVRVALPKALLNAAAGAAGESGLEYTTRVDMRSGLSVKIVEIKNVRTQCIIGVNPHERKRKQAVVFSLKMIRKAYNTGHHQWNPYGGLLDALVETVEASSFETVEALANRILDRALNNPIIRDGMTTMTVSVEKPSAVNTAEAVGVELTRGREWAC